MSLTNPFDRNYQAFAQEAAAAQTHGGCLQAVGRSLSQEEIVDRLFTYQSPDSEQLLEMQEIREGAKSFARLILRHVTPSADRNAAIRLLREAVMTANAAVVLRGLSL